MFLTVSTTITPATDLGYLLHKHPGRPQAIQTSVGQAHVFYPEATGERCTVALLLDVDPIGLVRRHRGEASALGQYVNDRPYAASSLLAVALGKVFRTALAGRCDSRPDLAARPIPLEVHVPALPCRAGGTADTDLPRRLFEPLGWDVTATPIPLDPELPGWGDSPYVDLRLSGEVRLADALAHLYVLLPVLDDAKHYWVAEDEVDKLVRRGEGWLAAHPEAEFITHRYLKHRRHLARAATQRLATDQSAMDQLAIERLADDCDGDDVAAATTPEVGDEPERRVPLAEQRREAVLAVLRAAGARRVGDFGCGGGELVEALVTDDRFSDVVATDVSARALEVAAGRLQLDRMPHRRDRLRIFQSSLVYRDERLAGLDAAVLMEVVEHVDPPRLPALERSVFGAARPGTVVVTTPNVEHNVRFDGLAPGALRHPDHRFEWTRAEFAAWAGRVAATYGYTSRILPVGPDDPEVGAPTQMAVFSR